MSVKTKGVWHHDKWHVYQLFLFPKWYVVLIIWLNTVYLPNGKHKISLKKKKKVELVFFVCMFLLILIHAKNLLNKNR